MSKSKHKAKLKNKNILINSFLAVAEKSEADKNHSLNAQIVSSTGFSIDDVPAVYVELEENSSSSFSDKSGKNHSCSCLAAAQQMSFSFSDKLTKKHSLGGCDFFDYNGSSGQFFELDLFDEYSFEIDFSSDAISEKRIDIFDCDGVLLMQADKFPIEVKFDAESYYIACVSVNGEGGDYSFSISDKDTN